MNRIQCISINHRTASVHIREQIRIAPDDTKDLLNEGSEIYVLNTCNRTEVYWTGIEINPIFTLIGSLSGIGTGELKAISEIFIGREAVRHLFTVASGIDSAVLGEPQILGQVKDAYRSCLAAGTTSTILNKALHRAFRTAKRVRTETTLGKLPVSVASEAVDLACHIFGDIKAMNAIVIGAGEMATLAAKRLKDRGITRLTIVNRTYENAISLAKELGGKPISFDELSSALKESNIVISSTGAFHPILTFAMMSKLMKERKYNPLFIMDIAVPRDVEQEVAKIYNCYLYNIDDLKQMVEKNMNGRKEQISQARVIIEYEVSLFERWIKSLNATQTIKELYDLMDMYIADQIEKMALSDKGEREVFEATLRSATKKFLNRTVNFLKSHPDIANIEHTRRIFQLDEDYQDRNAG